MNITAKAWNRYISVLRQLNNKAAEDMIQFMKSLDMRLVNGGEYIISPQSREALIDYAYWLATKYGEGATAAACEMYDAIALLQGANVPAAIPADTATYGEVAKAVNGTLKQGPTLIPSAVGRLVKMAGVDTTMNNAIRDGAYWAWIPQGDTCAFCITLASRGWQKASKKALKNGHAEHIHANCDCTYMVRFGDDLSVQGYDPNKYREMYYGTDEPTPKRRINAMRRDFYQENKERINAQKRSAYEKRKERESSAAEEINVD